jgi:hypothetical protein
MNQSDTAHNSKLGLSELIAMGVGGMIGGGIFSVNVMSGRHHALLNFMEHEKLAKQ